VQDYYRRLVSQHTALLMESIRVQERCYSTAERFQRVLCEGASGRRRMNWQRISRKGDRVV
jgi:hypothetical protein